MSLIQIALTKAMQKWKIKRIKEIECHAPRKQNSIRSSISTVKVFNTQFGAVQYSS